MVNVGTFIFSIWGLPEVIQEPHFGILEAPERLETHIWSSKIILRKKLCEERVALASQSDPLWPHVPQNRPQGLPKGTQKEPQEDPKWSKNRSKTLYKIKNVKISKMTTLPHEIHIFEGSKGRKIDPKALQIVFLGSSNGYS